MKNLNFKRILAVLLTLCLTLSMLPVSAMAATGAKDIDGHWAASAIEMCHTYGIMNGDGNGNYKPNTDITRAEFAAMVNRAFGYDTLSVLELTGYTDVPVGKWYANDMATAIALGIIEGSGNGIAAPEDNITREQATVILTKTLRLAPDSSAQACFTDMGDVSSWAVDAVLTMEQSGYIAGYNNQFMPKKNLTRGEAAQMLVNVFGVIVDGDFDAKGKTYQNVTIRKPGVVLKNANIKRDLFITEGVGDGDIWLDTVQISGRLLAAGGGENSIHVKDITVGDNVVVDKPSVAGDEPVRFRAIQTNDSTVIFQGTAREVIVTEDIIIIIDMDGEKTVFNMFKPEDGTAKPSVVINGNAEVEKITAFVPADIKGGGEVGKVEAHTGGVTVDAGVKVDPGNVEAEKGVEVKIGGETVTGTGITEPTTKPSDPDTPPSTSTPEPTTPTPDPTPAPTTPPSTGGGSSGGGNGGGTTTTNAKMPTISTQPQGASVAIGTTHTLTVSATVADSGTLSYQWYSNTSAVTSGGTAISGATSASYAAPISTAGTFYYYVVVTNTNNSVNGTKTASVTSSVVMLTVNKSLSSISVKTQPALTYTHGDMLDLTGLEVTLTYDDGSSEDVELADFASKNISLSTANGTAVSYTMNNGQPLTVSCGGQTADTNNLTVGKKSVTASLAVSNKVYDGNANATVSNITINGKITGDDVTVSGGNAFFDNANAGSGKTVNLWGWSLAGSDAGNYSLSGQPASATAGITPKQLTLTVGGDNLVLTPFDNTAFTYNVTGLVGSDTASVTCTTSGVTVWTSYLYISDAVTSTDVTLGFRASVTGINSGNYMFADATLPVKVYDGRATNRAIPITNANLEKFLGYIHDGSERTTVLSQHYKLAEDIALTEAWKPIGYDSMGGSYPFIGSFNGDGHIISNLNITIGTHYKALFAEIGVNGKVHNLKVSGSYNGAQFTAGIAGINKGTIQDCETNINITAATNNSGGIVGQNHGTVQSCVAKGNLTGSASFTGGVAGQNSGTMENCSASGIITVTGSGGNVGGVVGSNNVAAATVKGCSFTGTLISGHQYTGGIVGMNDGGTIENCFTTGSVTVNTNVDGVGGIVGNSRANGVIKNCYSTGDVTSQGGSVGGILGFTDTTVDATSTITNCYSTGNVSGDYAVGGIAGAIRANSLVENCYASGKVTATSGNAGGIVGNQQDSAMNNCVALNPSVTAKAGVEYGMGRVSGTLGNVYSGATGSDNYAWSGMTVQYNTNTSATDKTLDKGGGTKDGEDITDLGALWTTLGFTGDWWAAQSLPTTLPTAAPTSIILNLASVTVTTSGSALVVVTGTEDGYTFVGETVAVTATPDEGWVFVEWQDEDGNTVSTDAEYSFEVTGDVTLIAVCVEAAPVEPLEIEEPTAAEPRKEPDPVIVPNDNDEEDTGPDGDGDGNDDGGDSGNPSGENTPDEDGGMQADYFETLDSVVKSGARGEITVQEAIATLNNLLAYSASVTRG